MERGLEQKLALGPAVTAACVAHVESEPPQPVDVDATRMQAHRALRGELQRVVDQAQQHLAEPRRVAGDRARAARADIERVCQSLLACARLQLEAHIMQQLVQIEWRAIEFEASRLEPGEFENVVENVDEPLRRLHEHVGIALLRRIERARL